MLEIVGVNEEATKKRRTFFQHLFGNARGLLCLAIIDPSDRNNYSETFFNYPQELDNLLNAISNFAGDQKDIYFCPHLFYENKRLKEYVETTPCAWADLDYCNPDNLLIEPTLVVESSPGRFQAYWKLINCDPDDAENLSQRIAYMHADQGADKTGWDLTQLLRVPVTYNYKYNNSPVVKVISATRNRYKAEEFDKIYPETGNYFKVTIPFPEDLIDYDAESVLQSRRMTLNPLIFGLFSQNPTEDSWSEVLWKLLILLFEAGFNREEVYAIAKEASCNKYARDGRPSVQLWKDVCRAEHKHELNIKMQPNFTEKEILILSEDEREWIEELEPTFVERYIDWASKQTDAPVQYHQAGSIVALSSMLCGSVKLPTSYGTIVPNIWFMILADTTLTRKTTAMDLAMDVITEVDEDILMATDGSIEGMLTTLSARPGQPSIFLRDEFSGLLEQMTKKDYMSGMAEFLTKLYDAKMQRRVLRSVTVEVRQPRLIVFAGGIKDTVTGLLTMEQVSSGFIPRFIFITGESDTTKIRPIGPPTITSSRERDKIVAELQKIYTWYNGTEEIFIPKLNNHISQKISFECEMTPKAWVRFNDLENLMMHEGVDSYQSQVITPMYDRLCKSILKTAMLIACSRQFKPGSQVTVELSDLLRAIKLGEEWIAHSRIVLNNVGKGTEEYLLDRIMKRLKRDENGTTRSAIMQSFRLDARRTTLILDTLEQRGLVTRMKRAKTEVITPTKV